MTFDPELIKKHIPQYLSASDAQKLLAELRAFTTGNSPSYLLSESRDTYGTEMLQGDGWSGFQLYLFETGNRQAVRGMVLSNSCDIDPANHRELPSRIVFAPLVKLSSYEQLLRSSSIRPETIEPKLQAIRSQRTTNVFYLPKGGALAEEYIVRFDEIHSMPFGAHAKDLKLFTLSAFGFYLFILKLSIHFCRLQENVVR